MVGTQRRNAGSVAGHWGVIMWPFLSCKLQSYLGTERRRTAATAWLIASLKFNYPGPDVLPHRCSCGREESSRPYTDTTPHPHRHGTGWHQACGTEDPPDLRLCTSGVLGRAGQSLSASPCCAALPDGQTPLGRRGQELCDGNPSSAPWTMAIPLSHLFPNLPKQRKFLTTQERTAYCSIKTALPLHSSVLRQCLPAVKEQPFP